VQVLLLEDCTPIPSIGVADLFRKSVELAALMQLPAPSITLELVSAGSDRTVRTAGGIVITADRTTRTAGEADLVIVPALDPDVLAHLAQNRGAVGFVQRAFERGADVASICTGAFVLAEAGLLDGRQCATHWAFQQLLAERHPRAEVQPEAIVVDHGRIVTLGGATSFLTLTLFLVERVLGAEVARAASKMFLVDVNKPAQGAYAVFSPQKAHSDAGVLAAQRAIETRLSPAPSVEELAKVAGASVRTFTRRFHKATGNSPRDYIQRVRIEAAKRALERTTDHVGEVAQRVGYADVVAFRRLFLERTGLTPSEYCERYGQRVTPAWVKAKKIA
jgi:transcriptional regulator GlxA family with amidase domain